MKACISQVCVLSSTFEEDIKSFVEGGCPNMEVWLTKLEKHLETASIADTKALIADHGVNLVDTSLHKRPSLNVGIRNRFDLNEVVEKSRTSP